MPADVERKDYDYDPADLIRGIRNYNIPNSGRVVITGIGTRTRLGNTQQTMEGIIEGKSGIIEVEGVNYRTNIAGPLFKDPYNFVPEDLREKTSFDRAFMYTDIYKYVPEDERERVSPAVALSSFLAMKAAQQAEVVDENGKLKKEIDSRRFSVWIGSGMGPADGIIEVSNALHSVVNTDGSYNIKLGSRKIDGSAGSNIFPQDVAGYVAILLGARGRSGYNTAACATGSTNFVDLYHLILSGQAVAGLGGGLEMVVDTHMAEAIGVFARNRITSAGKLGPEKSSRPFDKGHDGFVPASGGAVFHLEELNHAINRGAIPLAEVYGAFNNVDGYHRTSFDPENIAYAMQQALPINPATGEILIPDAIFAHATATREGDKGEAEGIALAFGKQAEYPFIYALKDRIGHLLGGAGPVNIAMAVEAIRRNIIPRIWNLEEVDPEVSAHGRFNFVREDNVKTALRLVLCNAFGFGGNNSTAAIGPWVPGYNYLNAR